MTTACPPEFLQGPVNDKRGPCVWLFGFLFDRVRHSTSTKLLIPNPDSACKLKLGIAVPQIYMQFFCCFPRSPRFVLRSRKADAIKRGGNKRAVLTCSSADRKS